jgi:hypothetical protein
MNCLLVSIDMGERFCFTHLLSDLGSTVYFGFLLM